MRRRREGVKSALHGFQIGTEALDPAHVSPPIPSPRLIATGQKAVAVDAAMLAKLTQIAGDFAVNLSVALIILVATVFAARWAARATRRALQPRARASATTRRCSASPSRWCGSSSS